MTLEAVRPLDVADERRIVSPAIVPVLVAFVPIVGLAGAQGGFFPSSWGWVTLPLLLVAAVALAIRESIRLSTAEQVFLVFIIGLAGWTLASSLWSAAPAASILEAQRALLYVAAVSAALLVSRRRLAPQLLGGVLVATSAIAAFSLATRLLPDRVGVFDQATAYRLAQPIGYWNGLGIFTAMGAVLALGFAARARSTAVRAASAAALLLFLPTLYFTFGRGPWIALVCGVVAAVSVDPRRLQLLATLLAVGPAAAIGVWIASRYDGLTRSDARLAEAVHDGHRLALVLMVLAVFNAAIVVMFAFAELRLSPSARAKHAFAGAVMLGMATGLVAVFMQFGGPATLAEKAYDAFNAPPPRAASDLNRRLLSFSGNGRADLWRLGWDDAREHPVLGAGSGTYERYFLAHQPQSVGRVRDAHSLYVEALAEIGPIGLTVLLAALVVPLAVTRRARDQPVVAAAIGAYVAFLVHAGADWDWELPAVTLVGLLCAATILLAGRPASASPRLSPRVRWTAVGLTVAASGAIAVALVGNTALSRSDSARRGGEWAAAADEARLARALMPWSPAPLEALGRAQLGAGLLSDARRSFRKAIAIDRGDWELWYRLATASSGRARRDALRAATRLFPRAQLLRGPEGREGSEP
jgi:hypothetical protein